jgi:serine phosphatase RsbU (regulator of sigma subunit)
VTAVRHLYAPTEAEGRTGGDLHAVCESPFGLRALIGDVRGRGPEAAAGADALLTAFRAAAPTVRSLRSLAHVLEQAMTRHTLRHDGAAASEDFATAVLAQFSPDGRTLRLVNRGHPAPLLLRPGSVRTLTAARAGLPLGLRDLAPRRESTLALPFPADGTLLLFTDGTSEARDGQGVFYDPAARLARHGDARPEELVRLLRREVRAHTGARRAGDLDDMALLAVRPQRRPRRPVPDPGPVLAGAGPVTAEQPAAPRPRPTAGAGCGG